MIIRKSTMEDLPKIMEMYEEARQFMRDNGNPDQWGTSNPKEEWIVLDIEDGDSYVCTKDGEIVGTFYFRIGEDPTYRQIHDTGTGCGLHRTDRPDSGKAERRAGRAGSKAE